MRWRGKAVGAEGQGHLSYKGNLRSVWTTWDLGSLLLYRYMFTRSLSVNMWELRAGYYSHMLFLKPYNDCELNTQQLFHSVKGSPYPTEVPEKWAPDGPTSRPKKKKKSYHPSFCPHFSNSPWQGGVPQKQAINSPQSLPAMGLWALWAVQNSLLLRSFLAEIPNACYEQFHYK